jgi:PPK2 family polyphosphate:nucleotide phosphotransferase
MFNEYRVKEGGKFKLAKFDPDDLGEWKGRKEKAKARLLELRGELDKLQELLYAEGKHKLLVILQAMDTAGKDGTIRAVFEGVNPQGVRVANFKSPTPPELAHDYLWRVHNVVPGKGELIIFNRSHYEDVLIVRVHEWINAKECKRRFGQIREFERLLVEEGTILLKFFLHISQEEQRQRLLERIDEPTKQWKFNPSDLDERKLWPRYMDAYEDVIAATSTEDAPWYVVPANRNWYRNLIVASVIVDALKELKIKFPQSGGDLQIYKLQLQREGPKSPKNISREIKSADSIEKPQAS